MDDVIERIARHLRRPVQIDPALDGRVMREVNARPTHAGAPALRRAWGWLRRPHQLTLTPLGGLAAAAVLAIVILLSRMGSTPLAPPLAESRAFQFVLVRSEEHTSELQSHHDLVCRLLLEKKNSLHRPENTPISAKVGVLPSLAAMRR